MLRTQTLRGSGSDRTPGFLESNKAHGLVDSERVGHPSRWAGGRARMRMADTCYPASDVRAEQPWAEVWVPNGPPVPSDSKRLGLFANSAGFPFKQIFVLWA